MDFEFVEPVTVKQLRGAFGDQFRDREWEYRCDKQRTERWKEALASVSCKIGLTFDKKSNESTFVTIIVKEVESMLQQHGNSVVIPFSGGGQFMNFLESGQGQGQVDLSTNSDLLHEKGRIVDEEDRPLGLFTALVKLFSPFLDICKH
ncbi:protein PHLOEM PROTEIN 2-LIKE A8-like [Raphanus sativus]|nr:protein PHLOEM PROTEIN 2-LIKE A8-like [Raphanus sativus]